MIAVVGQIQDHTLTLALIRTPRVDEPARLDRSLACVGYCILGGSVFGLRSNGNQKLSTDKLFRHTEVLQSRQESSRLGDVGKEPELGWSPGERD